MKLRFLLLILAVFGAATSGFSAVISIPNIADLAANTTAADNDSANVAGYTTAGDGGGGTFVLKTGSAATPDGGMVIARTAGGRWLRVTSRIDVRMFGAKGDGVTNDRLAIQAAIDAAVAQGYESVHFGGLRYYVSGSEMRYKGTDESITHVPISTATAWQYQRRGMLLIGFHSTSALPKLFLDGEGATICTDDEKGGFATGTGDGSGNADDSHVPAVFLVQTKLKSLSVKDLTIERKVTGGREGGEDNFQTYTEFQASKTTAQVTLPQSTIPVGSTAGFPASGILRLGNPARLITYTGLTATTFTGCSGGGTGTVASGTSVGRDGRGYYFDRPYGANREGFTIFPHAPAGESNAAPEVETIDFDNVRFIDCHRAFTVENPTDTNYPKYGGKLKRVSVQNCQFLYPYGATTYLDPATSPYNNVAGYQATHLSTWVDTCVISNCRFDGASNGHIVDTNASDHYPGFPVDGFVFGDPIHLICTNNTIERFGVEGINCYRMSNIGVLIGSTISMPAENQTTSTTFSIGFKLPKWITPGTKVFVGIQGGLPTPNPGFMSIQDISGDRMSFKLKNLGGPWNLSPGTPNVNFNGQTLYYTEHNESASAYIAGNYIEGSPVPGRQPIEPSLHAWVGILTTDMKMTVVNNTIVNSTIGILAQECQLSHGLLAGSLIEGNHIFLPSYSESGVAGVGISMLVERVQVRNNSIYVPDADHFTGIYLGKNYGMATGNSVVAGELDESDTEGYGFTFGGGTIGNVLDGNVTENCVVGAGHFTGSPGGQFKVVQHESRGDRAGVVGAHIFRDQFVKFSPTQAGWYRIARGPDLEMSGDLRIRYVSSNPSEGYMSAHVKVDFVANDGSGGNIIQESFNDDIFTDPVIDKIAMTGSTRAELFVHVTRQSVGPIELTFATQTPGAYILEHPDYQTGTVSRIETYFSGSLLANVDFTSPHSFSVSPALTIFDLPKASKLSGHSIQSFPTTTTTSSVTLPQATISVASTAGFPTSGVLRIGSASTPVSYTGITGTTFTGCTGGTGSFANGTPAISATRAIVNVSIGNAPLNQTYNGPFAYFDTGSNTWPWEPLRILTFSKVGIKSLKGIGVGAGSETSPAINFGGNDDANTGIFQPDVKSIGIAIDGSLVARFDSHGIDVKSGTDDHPGYGFKDDIGEDTGFYRKSEDTIGIATGGEERVTIANDGLSVGGGTAIRKIVTTSVGVNFGVISGASFVDRTLVVTGVKVGDAVIVNPRTGLIPEVVYTAYVSSSNNVLVRGTNVRTAATASHFPTLDVTVISFGP